MADTGKNNHKVINRTINVRVNGKVIPANASIVIPAPLDNFRDLSEENRIIADNEYSNISKRIVKDSILSEYEIEGPKNSFEKEISDAVMAYRQWKYPIAVEGFLDLLDKYPQEGILYYYIANTFGYLTGGEDYSLRFYEKALEYNDYLETWIDYGNMLRHLNRFEEAKDILETARDRFPEDGTPAMILTHIYRESDQSMYKICKSEAFRRPCIHFDKVIREWDTVNQILKPRRIKYI